MTWTRLGQQNRLFDSQSAGQFDLREKARGVREEDGNLVPPLISITPNKQKRQKVLDLLGAFAYLETVMVQ